MLDVQDEFLPQQINTKYSIMKDKKNINPILKFQTNSQILLQKFSNCNI